MNKITTSCSRYFKVLSFLILISLKGITQIPAQTIPDFTFFRLDKTPFSNNNLEHGKKLFFIFFDSDCEHCQRAVSFINGHYKEFKNIPIYLITLDDQNKINGFIKKYANKLKGKKEVTFLQDKQYQFINKFQPKRYPSMFLYSSEGKLIDYEDNDQSVFRFIKLINENQ